MFPLLTLQGKSQSGVGISFFKKGVLDKSAVGTLYCGMSAESQNLEASCY
jgi:hypothetical protein